MTHAAQQQRREQSGFALVVLLAVVGVGSVGILLAVQAYLPVLSDRQTVAADNVTTVARAAAIAYRQNGSFPADLNALETAAGLPATGGWRRDPYSAGRELDYRVRSADLQVRSCGPDGQFGTADDCERLVATETQLRVRQRLRLRMLRAVLLRSPYRFDAGMSAAELQQMKAAMHDYAIARRRWLTADTATRVTLTATMVSATATVNGLISTYGLPALPVSLTGAGGLMSQLSMPDGRCLDGRGAVLQTDATVGWLAAGVTGGIDDDM